MATTKYTYVKHQGTWKDPKNVFIRQQGTWTQCKGIYYKRNGEWELVWPTRAANFTGSTTSVDFTTTLNQTSVKKKITIINSGDTDLRIYNISTTTPTKFTIAIDSAGLGGTPSQQTPRTIAPGKSAYFEASITAALLTGEDTGTITVEFYKNIVNDTANNQIAVTGTVSVLSAQATLDKTSLSFSASLTKASSAQTVKITNSGREILRITGITATTPTKYTIDTNFSGLGGTPSVGSPVSIAPGASRNFQVFITAGSSEGTDSGTITVAYITDLLDTSATTTISVSGTVNKLTAALTATPSSLSFSALEVSQQSSVQTVTLKNTGTDVLTVNSITPSTPSRFTINVNQKTAESGGIGATLPTTIAAGASKTIDVRITAGTSAGSDSGTISIGSTVDVLGGTSTTTVGVSGSVSLTQGLLTFSRNSVTLSAKQGLSSEKVKITLTNNSTISITNISLTVSQQLNVSYGTIFTIGDLPSTLAVGQSATVEVYFTAAAAATTGGTNNGTVKFSYAKNAAGTIEEKSIVVTCGVDALAPTISIGPNPINFTYVESTETTFNVFNNGNAPLNVTSITFPNWVTSVTPQTATISAGTSKSFKATKAAGQQETASTTLTVNTTELGSTNATIEVSDASNTPPIDLTGTVTTYKSVKIPAGITTCTVTVKGAGGGGGGYNASPAKPGQAGAMVTGSFSVTLGDTVAFHAGRGGGPGLNQVKGTGGGSGGLPYSLTSHAGGRGSNAGGEGASGGGGGGGAASLVRKNGNDVVVAAGGGGGGGSGATAARDPKNELVSGLASGTYGGDGASRGSFDGGGNGGGGGGAVGGKGGDYSTGGDAGGIGGSRGSSTGGTVNSTGGAAGGAAGTSRTEQNAGAGADGMITYTFS